MVLQVAASVLYASKQGTLHANACLHLSLSSLHESC